MDLRSLDGSGRLDAARQHVRKALKGREIRFTKLESDQAPADEKLSFTCITPGGTHG